MIFVSLFESAIFQTSRTTKINYCDRFFIDSSQYDSFKDK